MGTIEIDQRRRPWGQILRLSLVFLTIADQAVTWIARDIFVPWTLNQEVLENADWMIEKAQEDYEIRLSKHYYCEIKRFLIIYPYQICFRVNLDAIVGSERYSRYRLAYRGPYPFFFPPLFPSFNSKSYIFRETATLNGRFGVYVNGNSIWRTPDYGDERNEDWTWRELENSRRIRAIDELELEKLL